MAKVLPEIQSFARIKVIGVGGSGKGAINHMITSNLKGVDFIAMNTDTQDLHNCLASKKIHLGKNLTKGLGAGMDPEIGRRSAEETKEEIQDAVKGADIVFIACGMGGGTATGAAPIIAKAAKEEGILTVAIVTKPFFFEGQRRTSIAEAGIAELEKEVDALIVIPNDRLLSIIDRNMSVKDAFKMVDEVLKQAVDGIADIIKTPGTVNLDFADIKRVLKDSGTALIGIGTATGENRAVEAAKNAISSPLLDVSISGAKGLLYAVYGGENLPMLEVTEAAKIITESVDRDATIIFGIINNNDSLKKDEIKVVVIATKFPANYRAPRNMQPIFSGLDKDITEKEEKMKFKEEIESLDKEEEKIKEKNFKKVAPLTHNFVRGKKSESTISDEEEKIRLREDAIDDELDEEAILNLKNRRPSPKKELNNILLENEEEEEDNWNMLPPFLRRKK